MLKYISHTQNEELLILVYVVNSTVNMFIDWQLKHTYAELLILCL
jgi:hypothetical protein